MNSKQIIKIEKEGASAGERLRLTYTDGNTADFFVNAPQYPIHVGNPAGQLRYITISEDTSEQQVIKLVEKQSHIDAILAHNGDFSGCIFLTAANFSGKNISEKADFRSAIFTKKADFSKTIFAKNANFSSAFFAEIADFNEAIFQQISSFHETEFAENANFRSVKFANDAAFRAAKFAGSAFFYGAEFKKYVDFAYSIFKKSADFIATTYAGKVCFISAKFAGHASFPRSTFADEVNFNDAEFENIATFASITFTEEAKFFAVKFTDHADFTGTKFKNRADFQSVEFEETANFSGAFFADRANFLMSACKGKMIFQYSIFAQIFDISDYKKNSKEILPKGKIDIDLTGSQIISIMYNGRKFTSEIRETFLVLKNLAVRQNDNIRALEFYTQEMETHFSSLKFRSKEWGDKLILLIEKSISKFGTSAPRAFASFAAFNLIFFAIYYCGYDLSASQSLDALILIKDVVVEGKDAENKDLGGIFKFIRFIQTAVNVFLIYEIQKSLRKFSRKL